MTSEYCQINNNLQGPPSLDKYPIKHNKLSITFQISIYIGLGIIFHYLFQLQANSSMVQSDLPAHLSIINEFIRSDYYIPHPVFHLSVYYLSLITNMSIADVAPIIMTMSVLATLFIIQKLISKKSGPLLLLISISTIFVIAIYFPLFHSTMYLGQWSPNIWHSPTMLILKPISLLAFYFFVRSMEVSETKHVFYLIISSTFLLLSTVTKPSFVIVFLPAIFLYVLLFKRGEYRRYPAIILFAIPSIMMLAHQYIETYQSANTASYFHDKIIFTFFGVMKLYSPNIIISTLLVLAFPLAVLIASRSRITRNPYLILCWLTTVIAFLQFAFLAEKEKFYQGAFAFGYIIALFLLYIWSMKEFLSWFQPIETNINMKTKRSVAIIYLLHLVSGVYYFYILLKGGGYY